MRKFIAPLLLLCAAFILFFSCRKIEYIPNETLTPVDVSGKFFTLSGTVDPLVKAIHDKMLREEKQKPYVNQFVKWAGFPIWNKAMITSRKNSTSSRITLDSTTEVLLLPFAKDSQMSVSAIVVAIIHQGDTTLRTLYHFQYKDLPYDNGRFGSFSAEKAALLFMGFDKAVFGTEQFFIKDSLLFAYATPEMNHRFIKLTGDLTINKLSAEICWEVDETGGDCTNPNGPDADPVSCDIGGIARMEDCETFDLDDWPPPIGGGGSPGGGSPGGGTPWNDNPCKSIQITGGNTCGSGGPAWLPIDDPVNANGFYESRINELQNALNQNPLFLLGPCDYLNQFLGLANHQAPQSVLNRIAQVNQTYLNYPGIYSFIQDPFYIQNINDASSEAVNMDYFPIHITSLPSINGTQLTAQGLFEYFRRNWNQFVDTSLGKFTAYNDGAIINDDSLWNSSNPLSAMLHIRMALDGTVIVSEFYSSQDSVVMKVKTMRSPLDLQHPVSGTRQWGISPDRQNGGYTFYTTATDRITGMFATVVNTWAETLGINSGFDRADSLWRSLQQKMIDFISSPTNGGFAQKYNGVPDIIMRPDWTNIELYLRKQIDLAELRSRLGC